MLFSYTQRKYEKKSRKEYEIRIMMIKASKETEKNPENTKMSYIFIFMDADLMCFHIVPTSIHCECVFVWSARVNSIFIIFTRESKKESWKMLLLYTTIYPFSLIFISFRAEFIFLSSRAETVSFIINIEKMIFGIMALMQTQSENHFLLLLWHCTFNLDFLSVALVNQNNIDTQTHTLVYHRRILFNNENVGKCRDDEWIWIWYQRWIKYDDISFSFFHKKHFFCTIQNEWKWLFYKFVIF